MVLNPSTLWLLMKMLPRLSCTVLNKDFKIPSLVSYHVDTFIPLISGTSYNIAQINQMQRMSSQQEPWHIQWNSIMEFFFFVRAHLGVLNMLW